MVTTQQIYLLKSALLPEKEALLFWKKWKSLNVFPENDIGKLRLNIFDPLDNETQKVLAQVYHNLNHFAAGDPYLKAISSFSKYNWFRNERLWFSFDNIAHQLNKIGILPLLFKGGSTALIYYPNKNIRFLGDLDMFFHEHADTLVRALILANGGQDVYYFSKKYSPLIFHATQYSSLQKDDFDVHRNFLHEHLYQEANELLSKGKTVYTLKNKAQIYLPSPTVQLFLTLVHGTRNENHPKILWVTDTYHLLSKDISNINWDELYELAIYFKYDSIVFKTLLLLQNSFHIPIPLSLIDRLRKVPDDKRLRRYLANRDKHKKGLLPELYRSLTTCIITYQIFMSNRAKFSLRRWIIHNYAYRLERLKQKYKRA